MNWFANETWPFGAALALMVSLFVIEGLGLLLSVSPSEWIEGILPDPPDQPDGVLGWLHLGKVPFLILLGLFLAGFALAGFVIQMAAQSFTGHMLATVAATVPALVAGLAVVKSMGGLLARYMPGDETVAVSEQSLIGRVAVITQGHAREGMAAQAKLRDEHGRMHYVLVEPDLAEDVLEEGTSILLVRKSGAKFHGIRNPRPDVL